MDLRRLAEIRLITSPFKHCIPRCIEGEPVFFCESAKAHTWGHLHRLGAVRKYLDDGLCVWHREGIRDCNDSGHYPGHCGCHPLSRDETTETETQDV